MGTGPVSELESTAKWDVAEVRHPICDGNFPKGCGGAAAVEWCGGGGVVGRRAQCERGL